VPPAGAPESLSRVAALGRELFHDPSLSASGRQSCATCHLPERAFAGPEAEVVSPGGPGLERTGRRNAPSLRYLGETPPFHFEADGTAVGGFFRDGRADTLAAQARGPLLSPDEMANGSPAEFAARVARAAYAAEFRAVFGAAVFDDPETVLERALHALARYQLEDADFAPFTSKYDAFLAGTATLSDQELRGLALFNDPRKGNCAACHPSGRRANGAPPLFTDFTYDTLGVPRNAAIPANADAAYRDLGLCGPVRTDLVARTDLCGAFKVPTLRNVALTAPYFHNGRFATLAEVVAFYVRRDTNPDEWYPPGPDGAVVKFDDLPPGSAGNVNTTEAPYDRRPGDRPALTPAEIDDVVAFLNTLTDGYSPRG
jgi:cytochrome c peroxidase